MPLPVEDWGDEDYELARDILDNPPENFGESDRRALEQKAVLFETARRRPGVYAPEGIDAIDKGRRSFGAPVQAQPLTGEAHRAGMVRSAKPQPLQAGPPTANQTFVEQTQKPPPAPPAPTSATGYPTVPPPQFTPPASTAGKNPAQLLVEGWKTLPSYIPGGQTETFLEPSFEQFLREKGPALQAGQLFGELGDPLDPAQLMAEREESIVFKEWADSKWAEVYEKARAEGRPVTRLKYMPNSAEKVAGQVLDTTTGAAIGAVGALSFGVGDKLLKNADPGLASSSENHPVASALGSVAGSVSPLSLGGAAAQGITRGLGAAKSGAGVRWRMAASGIAGGAVGAGESVAGDVADAATSERELDLGGTGARAVEAAQFGGALGVGTQALAEGAGAGFNAVREGSLGPHIRDFERAGGELRVSGPTPPQPLVELAERAELKRAETGAHVSPVDEALDDLQKPMATAALSNQIETVAPIKKNLGKYYAATDDKLLDTTPLFDRAVATLKERSFPQGGELPFNPTTTETIRKQLPKMADAVVLKGGEKPPKSGQRFTFEELQALGITPQEIVEMARRTGHPVPDDIFKHKGIVAKTRKGETELDELVPTDEPIDDLSGFVVFLQPKKMNPRTLDQVTDSIDTAAKKDAATNGGRHDPAYDSFSQAVREVRDKAPFVPRVAMKKDRFEIFNKDGTRTVVTGYSAMKARHDALLNDTKELNKRSGLPEEIPAGKSRELPKGRVKKKFDPPEPALSVDEQRAQRNQLLAYETTPGKEPDYDALRRLSDMAGVRKELDRLKATKAWLALQGDASLATAMRPVVGGDGAKVYASGIGKAIGIRANPVLGALGGAPGTLADSGVRATVADRAKPKNVAALAKEIGPGLKRLLKRMRSPGPRRSSKSRVGTQLFGLAEGPAAARAEHLRQELTDEDIENLQRLIEANQEEATE